VLLGGLVANYRGDDVRLTRLNSSSETTKTCGSSIDRRTQHAIYRRAAKRVPKTAEDE
jgi:hypothetical protein